MFWYDYRLKCTVSVSRNLDFYYFIVAINDSVACVTVTTVSEIIVLLAK